MNSITFFLFWIGLSTSLIAAEFSSISLNDWNKEELSADHLRFTHPQKKELSIHLQLDSYDKDNFWNKESLSEDIKKMAEMRKTMSFFLGTSNYAINTYKFESDSKIFSLPRLSLTGSYNRIDNQLIHFSEINFYYDAHFLQIKIISEGKLPSNPEIEAIIKEVNPQSVDVD